MTHGGASRRRLLFISPVMPDTGGNGLAMRAGNLVEALGTHWDLHLLVLAVGGPEGRSLPPALDAFVAAWTELPYGEMIDPAYVRFARQQPGMDQLAALEALGRPMAVAYRPEAAARAAVAAFPDTVFDTVFVLRLYMSAVAAGFAQMSPRPNMLLDADDDDVTASQRFAEVRRKAGDAYGASMELATARHHAAWEDRWLPRFDMVFTASPRDTARMAERHPDILFDTLPNVVRRPSELTGPNPVPDTAGGSAPFLLIGNLTYLPNVEGARFFCTEVLPCLRGLAPELARVTIAGSSPVPAVTVLDQLEGVTILASPPDLAPLYRSARVTIVPLRAGGGTRIKILEAFAWGVPVVSTTLGAEGLAVEHERHLLIADTPDEFAGACLRLAKDERLHRRIADSARQLQLSEYSLEALTSRFAPASGSPDPAPENSLREA